MLADLLDRNTIRVSLFSFKKYQVEDGLSHNTVWCALQDSYGFIWLGTSDGLNRYDRRGNKVYRNVLNDKLSFRLKWN